SFIRRRIGVGPYFSGPGCWLILEIGRVDCRPILYFCNDCISVATTVPLPSGRHLMDEVVKVDGGLVVCDFRCCGVVQKPDVGEIVVAGRAYPFVSAEEPDGEVQASRAHARLPCERRGALRNLGSLTLTIFVLERRGSELLFGGSVFAAPGRRSFWRIISSCQIPCLFRHSLSPPLPPPFCRQPTAVFWVLW